MNQKQTKRQGQFQGLTLLEVLMAVLLSMSAMLVGAPVLSLSLKLVHQDRNSFDRQIALEQVWQQISERPGAFPAMLEKDCRVGEDRTVTVIIQKMQADGPLLRWKLFTADGAYSEERWLSR
ncbi:MAG TPA: hypothetical protein VGK99_04830 [Acidobacteriota bacterium]|jgi:Tfp pilus assembly protein PilV